MNCAFVYLLIDRETTEIKQEQRKKKKTNTKNMKQIKSNQSKRDVCDFI